MPRLSCIIPVVGSTDGLETTLVSVLENRPEGCEVLVVLGAAYDDPYDLQDEVRFIEAPGCGWAACATLGIRVSRGPVVHLLAPGTEIENGWAEIALRHFAEPTVGAVAPVIFHAERRGSVLAAGVVYHRSGRRKIATRLNSAEHATLTLGPTADAGFYRKTALEALGDGLPTVVGDHLADVDLALSLHAVGLEAIVDPRCRVYAHRLLDLRAGAYQQSLFAERLFWRNADRRQSMATLAHLSTVAGELLSAIPRGTIFSRLAGRLRGAFASRDYRLHRQGLALARQEVEREIEQHLADAEQVPTSIRIDQAHSGAGAARSKSPAERTSRSARVAGL